MQNLVIFMEPSDDSLNISSKFGKLYLNRLCIDEEAACELSGIRRDQNSREQFIMQNLVIFIQPSEDSSNISSKGGKLYMNRFCIDEEAACELSGVYYLNSEEPLNFALKYKAEGKTN